jgi:hypothetical protein
MPNYQEMSWTSFFPVFTDDFVENYLDKVTQSEQSKLDEWFNVAEVVNRKHEPRHVIATSLFWKRDLMGQGELPPISRETLMNAASLGLSGRFDPWEHYVEPLLEGARELHRHRQDSTLRVYLAKDLDFLVEDLVLAGCEVNLMMSSSIRHNPGSMWRFLALEESGCGVTIIDSDRARDIVSDLGRTQTVGEAGLGGWRVPYHFVDIDDRKETEGYRPMSACQFGSILSYPMKTLLRAFVWSNLRGYMPKTCTRGRGRNVPIEGCSWPNYGFDEWFLLAAMYPRMAEGGLLTFHPWDNIFSNQFFPIDIEYVTWANPRSELIYFDLAEDRHS